jgi:hypothetical protein
MSDDTRDEGRALTPLAIVKPPKPISEMSDEEPRAFADRIFDGIAAARLPA